MAGAHRGRCRGATSRETQTLNDDDRKRLAEALEILRGLNLEAKGMRRHVASAADLHELALRDVKRLLIEIRDRDRKRGNTWPGDLR